MSTGAYQAVFDFYQQAIVEKGWTVTSMNSKPGKAEWKLAKGVSVAQVEIDQEFDGRRDQARAQGPVAGPGTRDPGPGSAVVLP